MIWITIANDSGFLVELVILAAILRYLERKFSLRLVVTLVVFTLFRLMGEMIKTGMAWPRPCWNPGQPSLINCPETFSFPSGHAIGVMMAAVISFLVSGKNKWVGLAGAIGVAGVAVSRVIVGVHFPIDVISGVILGGLFGGVIWRIYWRDQ